LKKLGEHQSRRQSAKQQASLSKSKDVEKIREKSEAIKLYEQRVNEINSNKSYSKSEKTACLAYIKTQKSRYDNGKLSFIDYKTNMSINAIEKNS
jgi:hypothetical protein